MTQPTLQTTVMSALECYFATIDDPHGNLYRLFMAETEAALIRGVMQRCCGNQSHAARLLGISRNTLKKKLLQHEIVLP